MERENSAQESYNEVEHQRSTHFLGCGETHGRMEERMDNVVKDVDNCWEAHRDFAAKSEVWIKELSFTVTELAKKLSFHSGVMFAINAIAIIIIAALEFYKK
jgi:hypothetical protein